MNSHKVVKLLEPWPSSICAVPKCGREHQAHGGLTHRFISAEERMLIQEAGGRVTIRTTSRELSS